MLKGEEKEKEYLELNEIINALPLTSGFTQAGVQTRLTQSR